MTRYNWDLQELRKNRDRLKQLSSSLTDNSKKEELEAIANMYTQMLRVNNDRDNIYTEDLEFTVSWEDFIKKAKIFFTKKNMPYIKLVIDTYPIIRKAYDINADNNYGIALTNDELMDVTDDFFKKIVDKDTYHIFKRAIDMDRTKHFLNIRYSKYHYPNDCVTLFDNYLKEQYVLVTRNNTLYDLIALPHELFHFIFNDPSYSLTQGYNMRFLDELEGALANLLFGKYYKEYAVNEFTDSYDINGLTYNDSNFFINHYIGLYQQGVEELIIKNIMLKSANRKDKLNHALFNMRMKKEKILDPKKDYIELLIHLSADEETVLKYSFSYLAALDLYYQILEDKEKGFYNLRKLKENYEINDILNYLRFRDITFMDDGYANLKKYTKNMTN